jgi:hypothetical protein
MELRSSVVSVGATMWSKRRHHLSCLAAWFLLLRSCVPGKLCRCSFASLMTFFMTFFCVAHAERRAGKESGFLARYLANLPDFWQACQTSGKISRNLASLPDIW